MRKLESIEHATWFLIGLSLLGLGLVVLLVHSYLQLSVEDKENTPITILVIFSVISLAMIYITIRRVRKELKRFRRTINPHTMYDDQLREFLRIRWPEGTVFKIELYAVSKDGERSWRCLEPDVESLKKIIGSQ